MGMNGTILYRGPSNFNNEPIVVIATGLTKGSSNSKTGSMVQIYILSDEDEKPSDALYGSGKSASCCGDCKHDAWGTCYVNIGQGGNSVYGAYKRGTYPVYNPAEHGDVFKGKIVRFGTYGDPAMVPMKVWTPILKSVKGHTAYTHQWGKAWAAAYKSFCMASVDTQAEYDKAKSMGWRTFRVRPQSQADDTTKKRETVCPASEEQGYRKNCIDCLLCDGVGKSVDVVIAVHGTGYKSRRFNQIMEAINAGEAYDKLVPLKITARPHAVKGAGVGVK
jgi:hypothetical protein